MYLVRDSCRIHLWPGKLVQKVVTNIRKRFFLREVRLSFDSLSVYDFIKGINNYNFLLGFRVNDGVIVV